jgi:hypothetical protein
MCYRRIKMKSNWKLPVFLVVFSIVVGGLLLRSYGLTAPWARADHYNFGGPSFSRYIFCLRESSWKESGGRIHVGCPEERNILKSPLLEYVRPELRARTLELSASTMGSGDTEEERRYYLNHPPFFPWLLTAASALFGEREWVFRSVTLFFSILNILLVGLIALRVLPSPVEREGDWPSVYLAMILQAGFLGGIYFGTHVDYPNEIITYFILLSALSVLSSRWILAIAAGIIGGLIDWPGFFVLPTLAILAWLGKVKTTDEEKNRELIYARVITVIGCVAACVAVFGVASFLFGEDWLGRMMSRLTNSGHVEGPAIGWHWLLMPFEYVRIVGVWLTRMLGPVFFGLGIAYAFHYPVLSGSANWREALRLSSIRETLGRSNFARALFVVGAPMAMTSIVGAPYVMLHPFWFMLGLPFWALLLAGLVSGRSKSRLSKKAVIISVVIAAAFYPFGIHKSGVVIDLVASLTILLSVAVLIFRLAKDLEPLSKLVVGLAIVGNFIQTVNYRSEEPVDRDFCLAALESYLTDGRSVDLGVNPSLSRLFYCRGIPRF